LRFILPVAQKQKESHDKKKEKKHNFIPGVVHQRKRTISYITTDGKGKKKISIT
jgi:hypothetical protein